MLWGLNPRGKLPAEEALLRINDGLNQIIRLTLCVVGREIDEAIRVLLFPGPGLSYITQQKTAEMAPVAQTFSLLVTHRF
jgi:hypothetical protein